jgi:8-oxo-dGTP pyrophosphatase MutT (NUDIX family)
MTSPLAEPFPYDDALRARLRANLDAHERREHPLDGRKHAAVAIVVVDSDQERDGAVAIHPSDREVGATADGRRPDHRRPAPEGRNVIAGGASFLLSRRASRLSSHAGQWALPGGRLDPGESPVDAALRELHEELGLELGRSEVLGILDDYPTRSGYVITPVVLWGGGDPELHPNPDEVAHVYRIGLHELCREDSPRFLSIPESPRPVVQALIGSSVIHAPTAAAVIQFRWVAVEGRAGERVDGFEQPVFAWR